MRQDAPILEIDFIYAPWNKQYWLPSRSEFTLNTEEVFRMKYRGPPQENVIEGSEKSSSDTSRYKTGKIILEFSNYRINRGISDSFFEEEWY
jgi:hypothetical protein